MFPTNEHIRCWKVFLLSGDSSSLSFFTSHSFYSFIHFLIFSDFLCHSFTSLLLVEINSMLWQQHLDYFPASQTFLYFFILFYIFPSLGQSGLIDLYSSSAIPPSIRESFPSGPSVIFSKDWRYVTYFSNHLNTYLHITCSNSTYSVLQIIGPIKHSCLNYTHF